MRYVGVDGCRHGWFAILIDERGAYESRMFSAIAELADFINSAALILVDIPIGLRSFGESERACDLAARKALGPRSSSVFPAPVRQAIYMPTYEAASAENFRVRGRKLSKQSWAIIPKIREVDEFLVAARVQGTVREMHPEVCFYGLNSRAPMKLPKKKKDGFGERLDLLAAYYASTEEVFASCRREWRKNQLADDDILDALVGAVTAKVGLEGNALCLLPDEPEIDEQGLAMEMLYACKG